MIFTHLAGELLAAITNNLSSGLSQSIVRLTKLKKYWVETMFFVILNVQFCIILSVRKNGQIEETLFL